MRGEAEIKIRLSIYRVIFWFQYVSIHAAYLYDSVKLYARALDQLLRDQPEHTLEEIASNGTQIIETIIRNHTYQSKYSYNLHRKLLTRSSLKWLDLSIRLDLIRTSGCNRYMYCYVDSLRDFKTVRNT